MNKITFLQLYGFISIEEISKNDASLVDAMKLSRKLIASIEKGGVSG